VKLRVGSGWVLGRQWGLGVQMGVGVDCEKSVEMGIGVGNLDLSVTIPYSNI